MNDASMTPDLARRMAAAARELRAEHPPVTLLPAIHRAIAGDRAKVRVGKGLAAWFGWAGAMALCAVFALWMLAGAMPQDTTPTLAASGFVTVGSEEAWRDAARSGSGRVWLVSTEISQSRLAAFGLPYDPTRAGERVPAQLLVHGAGDVLAVRVIR